MRALRFLIPALLPFAALAGDFMPLRAGNAWTYRNAPTGQGFTVRVGEPVSVNNQTYYPLTGYAPTTVLARLDSQTRLVYFDEERGTETLLTSFQPSESVWWDAPLRVCQQQGQTQVKLGTHDGPAGPIQNVLNINYRVISCADAGVVSEQYAENIGMVRRVENTIAGPRQYDLVSARVGSLVIEAQNYARFTVAVDSPANSNFSNVTLRLETNSPRPFALFFASGQEYDVVVHDAQGNIVWSWAMGILFTQATHTVDVNGIWTAAVQAPQSAVAQGAYVTAFLTSKPRFEASTPLPSATAMTVRERILRPAPPGRRNR
jgi:hypothetical protein